jgi:uncharacterized protein
MAGRSQRRKELNDELLILSDETMILEELDGFIAGLLVCPELISPSEWLPVIWNEADGGQTPFADADHANFVFGLIMDHYNDVALTLMKHPERYRPLFPVDRDEILWEVWIEGFMAAVDLRPEVWEKFLKADEHTSDAMLGMLVLTQIVGGTKEIPQEMADEMTQHAQDLIPGWVVTLNNWRLANSTSTPAVEWVSTQPSSRGQKVGRNEPCPCGSGKKYKRCCGLN